MRSGYHSYSSLATWDILLYCNSNESNGLNLQSTVPVTLNNHSNRKTMGNGMNKVLPGLFVGSVRDSRDEEQIREHKITHILSIHDNPKRGTYENVIYMCVLASDQPDQNLVQFFPQCNDFIHSARLNGGSVLIHCLAGVSRSITILIAYLMSVTSLNWKDALKCVRAARAIANPNLGFQKQLQEFEGRCLREEKRRLLQRYHEDAFSDLDEMEVKRLVALYESMQVTLRSRRRAAVNNFADRQRPFTSSDHLLSSSSPSSSASSPASHSHSHSLCHSSSSPAAPRASSSSSSSFSFATSGGGSTRNYQLRRVNSSHLNYYSTNDNSNVTRSPNTTRRRSVTQLTGGPHHHFNSVTIRRANSATCNDEPNMSLLRIGSNLRNESEVNSINNCLPPSRPSSTPIYSVSSGSSSSNHHRSNRRRRQLPQCPEPNRSDAR